MAKGGTVSAELITVIRTTTVVGDGAEQDPLRHEVKYWSMDGQLLADGIVEDAPTPGKTVKRYNQRLADFEHRQK